MGIGNGHGVLDRGWGHSRHLNRGGGEELGAMLLPKAEARTVIDRFNVTDTGARSQWLWRTINQEWGLTHRYYCRMMLVVAMRD